MNVRSSAAMQVMVLAALAWLPAVASAHQAIEFETRAEEVALAESAGPPTMAAGATIYVVGDAGYDVAREGSNGASCLVSRAPNGTFEPTCLDEEGTRTILPVYMERGRLRSAGVSEDEINDRIQEGFDSGEFVAPAKAGVSYMLSDRNKVFNGSKVISYPPHIMVYAPGLTNADIGSDGTNPFMPWVLQEGSPHAYIVVLTGGR